MALLRRPARRKKTDRLILRRPNDSCGECQQYHRKRRLLPGKDGEPGRYQNMGMRRCTHRGYLYVVNQCYTMTLCICCLQRMRRRGVWIENRPGEGR
jgi:hypothetical protein